MGNQMKSAPGAPGASALWTSSAKTGVGKALNPASNVSFTLGRGILNEIYYPREDIACTRDMEFLITDGKDFFSEEKNHTRQEISMLKNGVPGFRIVNTCRNDKYRIEKEVITDTLRDTVLQRIKFQPLDGERNHYHLYALLSPHLGNQGADNTGWVDDYKGIPMLYARRGDLSLAMACSVPWKKRSAGFVGVSDGWQDLMQHKAMTWEYARAEKGNVALAAEIDLEQAPDSFTVAIGFGGNAEEAGQKAVASIIEGFDYARMKYVDEWSDWLGSLSLPKFPEETTNRLLLASASVLRINESKRFPGGIIASKSIPWGFTKGDNDTGGYHLVWPRDLAEGSGGLLALQSREDTLRVLNYLMATQESDGHWSQNIWLEGIPHMKGIQLDETALPILLMDLCREQNVLRTDESRQHWKTVRKAASYLVQNGPSTKQDRWEEVSGLTPFTLATEIAALLAAADFAEESNESDLAEYLRQTADIWNANIEHWTYVKDTPLAKRVGVEGYYIRVNTGFGPARDLGDQTIKITNRAGDKGEMPLTELVSVDALALVRFGLRAPDDPRILNTIKAIDARLRVDTPAGPCWHRYSNDGYGEHEDGSPFDGTGIGRAWPLLTGERGHYEVAAGHIDQANELKKAMESFAHHNFFPEQIWDTDDIPDRDLFLGKPNGSALPLSWPHSEYIKLCKSIEQEHVFDMPKYTTDRYIKNKNEPEWIVWRFEYPCDELPKGKILRIETKSPAQIHWSADSWKTQKDVRTHDTGIGIHVADLPTANVKEGKIVFTFYWPESDRWENKDFEVKIAP